MFDASAGTKPQQENFSDTYVGLYSKFNHLKAKLYLSYMDLVFAGKGGGLGEGTTVTNQNCICEEVRLKQNSVDISYLLSHSNSFYRLCYICSLIFLERKVRLVF
jgi:hypothetical protein